MRQILHGSTATQHAVRAAVQRSKAPLKELASQHGLGAGHQRKADFPDFPLESRADTAFK